MPVFKITLAYDGAEFCGWQRQPEQRTVQGELERAWQEITGEAIRVVGASRTDAGVHAAGQAASVESTTELAPEVLVGGLNAKLPEDVGVRAVEIAPAGFHATHDARRKRYRYLIYNDHRRPIFARGVAWHIPAALDAAAMQAAALHLVGTHDFVSFQSAGSERESTVRTIFAAEVTASSAPASGRGSGSAGVDLKNPRAEPGAEGSDDEASALVAIEVEGDGFLYNMVRTIAGTLVEVGRGRRAPEWVAEVIEAKSRAAAGQTAPPHGLTLLWVAY